MPHRNSRSYQNLSEQDWNFQSSTSAQLLLPKGSPQSYLSAPGLGINLIRNAHPVQGLSQAAQAGFSPPRPALKAFLGGILGHLSGISERCERQAVKCASRALNSHFSAPTTCHLCLLHFPAEMGAALGNNSYLQLLSRVSGKVGGQQWEVPPGLTAPLKF